MKMFQSLFTVASLTAVMAMPLAVCAEEPENYEADANIAEDFPPVIHHPVADNATGEECLVCHKAGIKGAPQTPHPLRLNCTQCHVRSDLSDPKKSGKTKKTKGNK